MALLWWMGKAMLYVNNRGFSKWNFGILSDWKNNLNVEMTLIAEFVNSSTKIWIQKIIIISRHLRLFARLTGCRDYILQKKTLMKWYDAVLPWKVLNPHSFEKNLKTVDYGSRKLPLKFQTLITFFITNREIILTKIMEQDLVLVWLLEMKSE